MSLERRFLELISKYSTDSVYNQSLWDLIVEKYSDSSRHYHDLTHLENMFYHLEPVQSQVDDLDCLSFTIFYHDIIYKATTSDNEHKSANFLEKTLGKTNFADIAHCKCQIEATKNHELSGNADTNILLDLDLSILGARQQDYECYTTNVRKEFKIYPDFMYRRGRAKFLKAMLGKQNIYKTKFFIERFESKARENLKRELEILNS
ncbi:hypothetical protein BST97_10530 [Nonlabens spongiae]|uniref:N-methyl-D-aspartate receptor NMDAR2C subunit n=1 Tax=Nonlabens spongiae TaxID=331648 RepID=A0A1W6MLD7_9FLAO|nr:hypothetical protein [Nonlabens spongiae]ARN78387.1 hypothetical protein BST97_10530 [Nonlabens spongiae]